MLDIEILLLFIVASLAINLSPGPSILYVTTVATSLGMRQALVSVAGMSVGIFGHVLAAATGMAALIAASATAFTLIKYLGAVYLIYLGVKTWLQPPTTPHNAKSDTLNTVRTFFYRGIIVDLLNPKIGLFFLAFLPQFVNTGESDAFLQIIVLGMIFIVVGGAVNCCIAAIAVKGARIVRPSAKEWIERWIPGGVLIGLGARLASEEV